MAEISRWLRRERELAFYGDVDLVPTESYQETDAARAMADAFEVYGAVERLMADRERSQATQDESPPPDQAPMGSPPPRAARHPRSRSKTFS